MKLMLLSLIVLLNNTSNAQYLFPSKDNNVYGKTIKEDLEYIVPITSLGLGFSTNFILTKTDTYYGWTEKKQAQTTFKIYSTTVICIVGSHYLIKWIETKPIKRMKQRRKHRK